MSMPRTQRRRIPAVRNFRPNLEALEDRNLPSSVVPTLSTDLEAYQADQIIVRWLDGASPLTPLADRAESLDGQQYLLHLKAGISVAEAVAYYKTLAGVDFAQPNYRIQVQSVPNDPSFNLQWGLRNLGQTGGTTGADIGAVGAWDFATGSAALVVAVIDTGVEYTHPDLAANMWINSNEAPNGIDDDGNGFTDDIRGWDFRNNDNNPNDDNGHGTHVAGIIGAVGNNGIGITGVAWNVRLMALKFLGAGGSGFDSDAIRAIDYAWRNGARIINASWAGTGDNPALSAAIGRARAAGTIFVAAAGNDSINNDLSPEYPASYTLDNIISVGASTDSDAIASFSNYGASSVDLVAPGTSIYSTWLGGTYTYQSGTSMAAPHVTGALAVLWSLHPNWSHQDAIAAIIANVDKTPSLNGVVASGGRLDLYNAIVNTTRYYYNSGVINQPIADRGAAVAYVFVYEHRAIGDIDVMVSISHTYDADLVLTLISPSGNAITLANRRGKSGNNYTNTWFDEQAVNAIPTGVAPFTGYYRPDGALSAFNGGDAFGTWSLLVRDMAPRDVGVIHQFIIGIVERRSGALSVAANNEGTPGEPTVASAMNVTTFHVPTDVKDDITPPLVETDRPVAASLAWITIATRLESTDRVETRSADQESDPLTVTDQPQTITPTNRMTVLFAAEEEKPDAVLLSEDYPAVMEA